MRFVAAVAALAALAGCASQSQPRALYLQVFEQRSRYQIEAPSVNGQHALVVRITNRSDETITVDAITLMPQTNGLRFSDNDQTVSQVLEPGETTDVQMWIGVVAAAGMYVDAIDSVDASVTAHSPSRGTFTETQACGVSPVS